MKLILIILIAGAALFTGLCADDQTVIPTDRKKEADKTYADGRHYFIWPATNAPIKSTKIRGLTPGGRDNMLMLPIKFRAVNGIHEPFCLRMKIVGKEKIDFENGTATANEITSTWCDLNCDGKTSGGILAVYLPTQTQLVAGKTEATIHLIKKSEEMNKDAKPISNATTLKIIIEP